MKIYNPSIEKAKQEYWESLDKNEKLEHLRKMTEGNYRMGVENIGDITSLKMWRLREEERREARSNTLFVIFAISTGMFATIMLWELIKGAFL
ncbi:MAG: hypothetical protein EOM11_06065 [Erysipelotrichia bacterium]|nr:hypothetical protein [Erysipelotrichia bacterium]